MCDKCDNLWLNLTDGSILCGRKFWDGSGGNNHALDHYAEVKYPLAVKLGTITPTGAGKKPLHIYRKNGRFYIVHPKEITLYMFLCIISDVFSYDEDEMVEDPDLAKHLEHWGIDIMKMEKVCIV